MRIALLSFAIACLLLARCCGEASNEPDPEAICRDHSGLVEVGESGVVVCRDGFSRRP